LAAYKRGNYITAYGALYPLAEEGNASAQNLVGVMILKGMVGKEPDPDLALSWFSRAADDSTATKDVHDNAVYNRDFLAGKLKEREASPSIVAGPIVQSNSDNFLQSQQRSGIIARAKASVLKTLRDPGSAQFSDVVAHKNGSDAIVCGFVNAKNGYGGYTGRKAFIYTDEMPAAFMNKYDDQILEACKNAAKYAGGPKKEMPDEWMNGPR
jgi:TPR repeat protein